MTTQKNKPDFFTLGPAQTANLKNDLTKLLGTYRDNKRQVAEIISLIIAKYSEKHRFYHNLSHIHALLSTAETFREKISDFDAVRLAAWFHDVIYEPKNSN